MDEKRELVHYSTAGAAFDLPEAWTLREVMAYESRVILENAARPTYERLWSGVRGVAQNWTGVIPLDFDLDQPAPAGAMDVLQWACMITWGAFQRQKEPVEKN